MPVTSKLNKIPSNNPWIFPDENEEDIHSTVDTPQGQSICDIYSSSSNLVDGLIEIVNTNAAVV